MTETDIKTTILERLSAVADDLGHIEKAWVDQKGAGRFKAFAVDDIYANLRPLFSKYGVVVIPWVTSVEHGVTERGRNTVDVEVDYQFHGLAGDQVTMRFAGSGHDGGDKGVNKAVQMAFKYGLIQMFQISTGEVDPDAAPDDSPTQKEETPKQGYKEPSSPMEKRLADLKNAAWKLVYDKNQTPEVNKSEAVALVTQTVGVFGQNPKNKNEVEMIIAMMKGDMETGPEPVMGQDGG